MATLYHFHATASLTMCGQGITGQTLGSADAEEFASLVSDPSKAFCPKCVALLRRYQVHNSTLRNSLVARLQALGLDVTHG